MENTKGECSGACRNEREDKPKDLGEHHEDLPIQIVHKSSRDNSQVDLYQSGLQLQSTLLNRINPIDLQKGNYTVNFKGCTKRHVGTKIEAPSITLINNTPSNLIFEQQTINNRNHILKYKNKRLIWLSIFIVVIVFFYIFYNSTVIIDDEKQNTYMIEATDNTNKETMFIIPDPCYTNRTGWNASPIDTKYVCTLRNGISSVIISETNTTTYYSIQMCAKVLQSIQNQHSNISYNAGDINYNFMIGGDGRIYEGRGWKRCNPYDVYSVQYIKIALIGNYSCTTNNKISSETLNLQMNALEMFMNESRSSELTHSKNKPLSYNHVCTAECCTRRTENPGILLHEYVTKKENYYLYSSWISCLQRHGCHNNDNC